MKKKLLIISISLIAISLGIFLYINISINKNIKNNYETINIINELITTKYNSNYEKNDFSTLEINNKEYLGIIAIPSINIELPVMANCNYSIQSACFYPSDNLTIIATNLSDSIPMYKDIEINTEIIFIDMLGKTYSFEINNIEDIKSLKQLNNNYNINLIVKNYLELSYTIYEGN